MDEHTDVDAAIAALDWERDGDTIRRSYDFDDYGQAVAFTVRAALAAERRNHHPDLLLTWGRVDASLTTHDEGGLTEKDVELARVLDEIHGG